MAHAAAPYLQKAAEGLATGAGVETAKLLFKCFADSLRKRDFVVTEPGVASKANEARNREAKKAPSQKKKPKTKKKKAQGKRKKSRR